MILAQNKLGLLNTNKVRAICQPHVLEFQQAVFPEQDYFFFSHCSGQAFSMFWDNLFQLYDFFFRVFKMKFSPNICF